MLTLYSRNTVTLGSPGIDDKYGSSVSMRGVVSSTSTNKLTILITGNTTDTYRAQAPKQACRVVELYSVAAPHALKPQMQLVA